MSKQQQLHSYAWGIWQKQDKPARCSEQSNACADDGSGTGVKSNDKNESSVTSW